MRYKRTIFWQKCITITQSHSPMKSSCTTKSKVKKLKHRSALMLCSDKWIRFQLILNENIEFFKIWFRKKNSNPRKNTNANASEFKTMIIFLLFFGFCNIKCTFVHWNGFFHENHIWNEKLAQNPREIHRISTIVKKWSDWRSHAWHIKIHLPLIDARWIIKMLYVCNSSNPIASSIGFAFSFGEANAKFEHGNSTVFNL